MCLSPSPCPQNPDCAADVVPPAELQAARQSWLKDTSDLPRPIKREHPM